MKAKSRIIAPVPSSFESDRAELLSLLVEKGILFEEALEEFEKRFIKRTLDRAHGNQCRAAKMLGIHRNTLSRKIGEYKLDRNGSRRR